MSPVLTSTGVASLCRVRLSTLIRSGLLSKRGIGSQVHYIPVHRHPYYQQRYPGLSFPIAEAAYERLLTLPLHAGMREPDVDDVVSALDKVTAAYRA